MNRHDRRTENKKGRVNAIKNNKKILHNIGGMASHNSSIQGGKMLGVSLQTWLIFGLGIFLGMLLANKDFRVKFFKGFRGFLAQLNKGARVANRQATGQSNNPQVVTSQTPEKEIQHVYKQVHTSKPCPLCKGSGKVIEKVSPLIVGAPGLVPKPITCPNCNGEGVIWN